MNRILATSDDLQQLKNIKQFLAKHETTDETSVDWVNVEMQDVIERIITILTDGPNYFKPPTAEDVKNRYFHAECDKCGWHASSKYLLGGGPIADTGDYSDTYCPVCGNTDIGAVTHPGGLLFHE